MNVVASAGVGVLMGVVFGFALEKSRVFEPGSIIGQMQLRSFLMLKIFLTAVTTGLVVLAALNGIWGVKMSPKSLLWGADILGGLLLGAGIAIAGACPGTVFAQIGAGYRDAWFTVAGGILGALVFGYLEPALRPVLLTATVGAPTFDRLVHVPFWALALLVAAAFVGVLVALERWTSWRDDIGPEADGLVSAIEPRVPSPVVQS